MVLGTTVMVRRPAVIDYKLVDARAGCYFGTDQAHPGASCWSVQTKSTSAPDATAEVFDLDGFYRPGTSWPK